MENESGCNYCEKGFLEKGKRSLNYPYEKVLIVEGKSVSTIFCEDCFEKMINMRK